MNSRLLAWAIKVRNKSGGSSSEWAWEAGRKSGIKFSLGHLEIPIGNPTGQVQWVIRAMDLDLRGVIWARNVNLGLVVG